MLNQPSSFSIGEIYDEFFLVLVEIGAAKFATAVNCEYFLLKSQTIITLRKRTIV